MCQKLSVTQYITHSSRLQYTANAAYQGCLNPASYTADRSLLEKLRVRTQSAHVNHVILRYHTCYAISRLGAQSLDSENVQCNLEIAQTAQNIYAKNTLKWKNSGVIKKTKKLIWLKVHMGRV